LNHQDNYILKYFNTKFKLKLLLIQNFYYINMLMIKLL